jgi:dienelactone hydrolase
MELDLQIIATSGIRLRVAMAGEGPLVILIHGFPEGWYSWRHQIPALANAGYRVAAPDVRGYGGSDRPLAIEAYTIKSLCADIDGLIAALGAVGGFCPANRVRLSNRATTVQGAKIDSGGSLSPGREHGCANEPLF